jgi:hypothetical protein
MEGRKVVMMDVGSNEEGWTPTMYRRRSTNEVGQLV